VRRSPESLALSPPRPPPLAGKTGQRPSESRGETTGKKKKRTSEVSRLLLAFALALPLLAASPENLIVCDEVPAMQNLAKQIETRRHQTSEIASQNKLPASLAAYRNVIVYIHGDLHEPAELAFIDYAKTGGNLILLHHTISSGKRKNKYWLPFLGVTLPRGYKYIDDATWDLVPVDDAAPFTMHETEIYLNHEDDPDRTLLMGLRYSDPKDGRLYEQQTAAWMKKTDRGVVWYFMPGHKASDFEYEPFVQLLMSSVK
jgi:hypothetical protein